jgi:hypothetical protein
VREERREVVEGLIKTAADGEVGERAGEAVERVVEVLAHDQVREGGGRGEEGFRDPADGRVAELESRESVREVV